MRLTSSVWRTMLAGSFKEAAARKAPLPEDNAIGLRTLLLITHMQYCRVPRRLTLEELGSVAGTCEKHDMTTHVRPYIRAWLETLATGHGFVDDMDTWFDYVHSEAVSAENLTGVHHWLWVSYPFGEAHHFSQTVAAVLRFYTRGGLLNMMDQNMPEGIIGGLLR
jgi:hypothetical protein